MNINGHIETVIATLLTSDAHRAVKYITAKHIVRATRRLYRGRIDKRGKIEMVLTIGAPNYIERKFIADCKKAGESFPVRKVQLKFPPRKKRA